VQRYNTLEYAFGTINSAIQGIWLCWRVLFLVKLIYISNNKIMLRFVF